MPRGTRNTWWPNLLLAGVAVGMTLLVAEGILRWTWSTEKVTLVHDPLLGFRGRSRAQTIWHREMFGRPRMVTLNEAGFHDHPRASQSPPGTKRLVFLGDSFLEAYQVEIDSSFAQRLARLLPNMEAVNLGVHGYGLGVYALQVRQELAVWHADGVVLCLFLGNDLHDNFAPIASPAVPRFAISQGTLAESHVPARGLRIWLRDEVLARSSLGRWIWLRVIKSSGSAMAIARAAGMVSTPDLARHAAGQHRHMLEVGETLLKDLIDDLQEQSLPLHVLVIPDPFLVHDLAQQHRGIGTVAIDDERYQTEAMVEHVLKRKGVTSTWLRDRFVQANLDGSGVYRHGFGHFTDAAHPLVAKWLAEPVSRLLGPSPVTTPPEIDMRLQGR
ncbi:MAG: SGNH/GDSL hydrolase family protein [Gemmatimonadetes bacterium]|jgi:hypothetical protein|nr:SGNH/GDSL hydrolase family protein [Gemmatimonadota bacterium]MBT4610872.1 SGNH/GDSL hydrolase family protein [Gemmatimonadota bacterium]MBT5059327.1 SGNH/GDSL hydrolase family protein [Gemmatimonadota bacterium]MBT5145577.1 SGNH/GDSL hydrolase family protein [Gemmatimonadota bacterium]MBT5591765.1 SGNH/GDSL hydrolase family protein [Gemmatimonadota bacterium]